MDIGPEVQMKTEIKGLIKKKRLESRSPAIDGDDADDDE